MTTPSTASSKSAGTTVGAVAELVRSKNAGPFWQTLDIFLARIAILQDARVFPQKLQAL